MLSELVLLAYLQLRRLDRIKGIKVLRVLCKLTRKISLAPKIWTDWQVIHRLYLRILLKVRSRGSLLLSISNSSWRQQAITSQRKAFWKVIVNDKRMIAQLQLRRSDNFNSLQGSNTKVILKSKMRAWPKTKVSNMVVDLYPGLVELVDIIIKMISMYK